MYSYKYNKSLVKYSKSGRKNQTDAEKFLWKHLRNRQLKGLKFRRQYPISNYILDFYCVDTQTAIELDGGHHLKRKYYDSLRTQKLNELGIVIIRFWDNDVLQNIKLVLEDIIAKTRRPHPNPLLKGEGENR